MLVAVFRERFIRRVHCDTRSVHTVADMPLLRHPLHLGVAMGRSNCLTPSDSRDARDEEARTESQDPFIHLPEK